MMLNVDKLCTCAACSCLSCHVSDVQCTCLASMSFLLSDILLTATARCIVNIAECSVTAFALM